MNMLKIVVAEILALAAIALLASCATPPAIKTKKDVDLKSYMGKWHEIARFENSFQKGVRDSSAVYAMRDDGQIDVFNSGYDKDGNLRSAKGVAYVPDPAENSKTRVSFFYPFYADYYILELAPDYSWALVGSSSPDYLWVLSRTKTLPESALNEILALAKSRNYDVSKLKYNGRP